MNTHSRPGSVCITRNTYLVKFVELLLIAVSPILTGSIENGRDFVIQMMSLATYLHACTYIVDVCVGGGGDEKMS